MSIEENITFSLDAVNAESTVGPHVSAINGLNFVLRYAEEQGWPLNTQFSLRQMRIYIIEKITATNHN